MKIGMNLYLWTARLTAQHFALFSDLKALGFDGVEIPVSDYTATQIKAICSALDGAGLECTAATILAGDANPIAVEKRQRQIARDQIQRDIDVAAALGAVSLVGPIHSAHKVFPGRGPSPAEFERCVDFLQFAGDLATAAKINLSVEALNRFECYFLNLQSQARALVDAVDRQSVGILYDTHHAHIEENSIDTALRAVAGRINHFHVSESHRGTPGTGTVDWATNFNTLSAINYDGWIVIEAFATDVDGIPEAINIWRDCFSSKAEVTEKGIELIRQYL